MSTTLWVRRKEKRSKGALAIDFSSFFPRRGKTPKKKLTDDIDVVIAAGSVSLRNDSRDALGVLSRAHRTPATRRAAPLTRRKGAREEHVCLFFFNLARMMRRKQGRFFFFFSSTPNRKKSGGRERERKKETKEKRSIRKQKKKGKKNDSLFLLKLFTRLRSIFYLVVFG